MTEPLDPAADLEWVRALCARLCFPRSAADDLAQEVWTAALRTGPDRGVPVRAWLAGIAKNLARMLRRGDARRERRERATARTDAAMDTAHLVAAAESQQRVLAAVNALPMPMREAVLLRFYEGLPPRAIAARLAIPVATVRTRLARAQEHLRQHLDRDFGDRRLWLVALATLPRPHHVAAAAGTTAALVHLGVVAMGTKKMLVAAAALVALVAVPAVLVLTSSSDYVEPPDWGVDAPVAALFDPTLRPATRTTDAEPARRVAEQPARSLRGVVVDENGAPIAGAVVSKWPRWMASYLMDEKGGTAMDVATTTGADGTFALTLLGSGKDGVSVVVDHPQYVAVREAVRVAFDVDARVVMMRAFEVPLEVQVVERGSGAPVPFFRVSATTLWANGDETDPKWLLGQMTVPDGVRGRDGLCRTVARALVGRPLRVHAMVPGQGPGEFGKVEAVQQEFAVSEGESLNVRFEVELGVAEDLAPKVQRGRVVSAKDGNAIAGAVLRTFHRVPNGWASPRHVQSRADGSFAIALPKDGTPCAVQVEHDDWQAEQQDADPEHELVFRVLPRSTLRLRVVDAQGGPIAGAHLLVFARGDEEYRARRRTDAEGRVELPGLLERRYHVFVVPSAAAPDEQAIASESFWVGAGATREAELVVDAPGRTRVFGVVTGGPEGLVPTFVPMDAEGRWVPAKALGRSYDAAGLARGEYLVVLRTEDDDRSGPIVLVPNAKVTAIGSQALDFDVPVGSVRGRLTGLEAEALRQVRVVALPRVVTGMAAELVETAKFAGWSGIATGSDGAFEVPFVGDGEWRLVAWRGTERLAERHLVVRGGADAGEWRLQPGGGAGTQVR